MRLQEKDWLQLRGSLLWLLLALIVVICLSFVMLHYLGNLQAKIDSQQGELNQAKQRLLTSGQEKETIEQYLPRYQALLDQGFIGEEKRIDWVDALRNIHMEQKLYAINYSIGKQEPYQAGFASSLGAFSMHRSPMQVSMDLLHEEDILRLIDSLSKLQTTPFIVRDCVMNRIASGAVTDLTPHLNAQCEIEWVTLREPYRSGGTP